MAWYIFDAATATAILGNTASDLSGYVIAVYALLAGFYVAIRWFKRGVKGVASGKVK